MYDLPHACMFSCWGFDVQQHARDYEMNSPYKDAVHSFRMGKITYVINQPPGTYDTHKVQANQRIGESHMYTLRERGSPAPTSAISSIVLVEGPTSLLMDGYLCDCYVAWTRLDGNSLRSCRTSHLHSMYGARCGNGILYARSLLYQDGQPHCVETRCYGLKFYVMDKNPDMGHVLKITCCENSILYSQGPHAVLEPELETVEPTLIPALKRAQQGFKQHCTYDAKLATETVTV